MNKTLWLLVWVVCTSGCTLARVDVTVLSERSSLENQILGTYNAIDREMLFVASVRGVDASGRKSETPQHSQQHQDAVMAMQVLAFHEDDIQAFKMLGWIGENNQGLLSMFDMQKSTIPPELKEFAQRYTKQEFETVITQVNQAREAMMQRVIDMNESLKQTNLSQIKQVFAKINTENAKPGEAIQTLEGQWITKK
ncbi:MAG: DUF1318 domain-containing protein [Desulfobacterales bacterium]|nr:DUF1318 domain-containing protein [Desulfobacterales bacterium]